MSLHKEHILSLANSEHEYKLIINAENDRQSIQLILNDLENPLAENYHLKLTFEELKLLNNYFRMFDTIVDCANNISNIIKDCSPKLIKENQGIYFNLKIYIGGQDTRELKLFLEQKPIDPLVLINELKGEIKKLNTKISDFEIIINQKDKMYNELKTNYDELKNEFNIFKEQYRVDMINIKSYIPQQNYYNSNYQNPNLIPFQEQLIINSNEKSTIIDNNLELNLLSNKIRILYPGKNVIYNLLYRKSRDGGKESIFHQKCDKIRGTLIIIKTKEGIKFGGYTNESWEGNNVYKTDNTAFLFSLNNNKIYDIKKDQNAIFCDPNFGPTFCGAINVTLAIIENCDSNKGKCCKAEHSNFKGYNYDFEINNEKKFFDVQEYEVFKVTLV